MNILKKIIPENEWSKSRSTKMHHEIFDRGYNEMQPCTWRNLCFCGSCNPAKKIVPAENWNLNFTSGLVLKPVFYYYYYYYFYYYYYYY